MKSHKTVFLIVMLSLGYIPAKAQTSSAAGDVQKAIEQLRRSPDPVQRAVAACSLGKMGSRAEPAVPSLIAMLGDETPIDQIKCWESDQYNPGKTSPAKVAAKALAEIGDGALAALETATLTDRNWKARNNAAWALGEMQYDKPESLTRAVQALKGALEDERWEVQSSATSAMGEINDSSALGPLTAALKKPDSRVRSSAAAALGEIAHPSSVPALLGSLEDQDYEVRKAAARALGEIKDRRAVSALKRLLKDEQPEVRREAAKALSEIADQEGADAFTHGRSDRSRRAIEPLIVALDDPRPEVRKDALKALREVTGKDFGPDPAEWRRWLSRSR